MSPKILITEPESQTLDWQRGEYHEKSGESARKVDLSIPS
jgi:hypothetical protein